ncbi:hypothetical protein APSETT444_005964 [Aspergillus pseudonomiae]
MVFQDFDFFERVAALATWLISVGQVEKLAFGPCGQDATDANLVFGNYLHRMAASREPTALHSIHNVDDEWVQDEAY